MERWPALMQHAAKRGKVRLITGEVVTLTYWPARGSKGWRARIQYENGRWRTVPCRDVMEVVP